MNTYFGLNRNIKELGKEKSLKTEKERTGATKRITATE